MREREKGCRGGGDDVLYEYISCGVPQGDFEA
jgi:hypothetical protein